MRTLVLPGVLAMGLLAGCASVHPVPTTVVTPGMPNPEVALQGAIQHVDAEMAELGQLRPAPVTQSARPVVPAPLERIVSFRWKGPLDQAVAKLAQSIGYAFYTTSPPKTRPLDVSITLTSVPVIQVFKALGVEAGTRATVEVDAVHHEVQVIHHV